MCRLVSRSESRIVPFQSVFRSFLLQDAAELVQKLEGHQDRVYSAAFHPTEPLLASCSADFTIRLWASA